jgi:hypothetical protein
LPAPINDFTVGDIGNTLLAVLRKRDNTLLTTVASASSITFTIKRADNTIITRTGSLYTNGSDGTVKYTWIDGDLTVAGIYTFQVIIEWVGGNRWASPEWAKFRVGELLA